MMDGTEFLFPENARVRLKGAYTDAYGGYACAGNEGWVRKNERDKFGLPKVWVEWDTNHWAYNGVADGWTFQDHFELAEEVEQVSEPTDSDQLIAAMAELLASHQAQKVQKSERFREAAEEQARLDLAAAQESAPPGPSQSEFEAAVAEIARELATCEAFVVTGVAREGHHAAPKGVLRPFAYRLAKAEDAEVVCDAQLSRLAAQAHLDLALARLAE